LLALNSKLAALHVQYFQDSEVLKTVNEVEMLAHALSDKIWQKIIALDLTVNGAGQGEQTVKGLRKNNFPILAGSFTP
jgi:hypothetical protein